MTELEEVLSKVEDWTQLLHNHNITTVVASNMNLTALNTLDLSCQKTGVNLVACDVQGVCGYVFNNFQQQFHVIDTDGEERKEVSKNKTVVAGNEMLLHYLTLFSL